jgi:hypothetical protein
MVCDETELALLALPADAAYLAVEPSKPVIVTDAATIMARYRIIRFRGRAMIEVYEPYPHFILLTTEHFTEIATPLLGWVRQSRLNDVFDYVTSTAPDLTCNNRLVLFGNLADTKASLTVWDMVTLEARSDITPTDCVRRSPYSMKKHGRLPIPLIMQLAGGDEGVYDDIMQSLAPLVMALKPEGVIWWVGADAQGKSILMDALRRIFPDQLASITNQRLAGGRVTRILNGNLGNIVESDSGQVQDVGLYRSLAKHQSFGVHQYHSQNGLKIHGNIHHIFSADSAPRFSRKSWSTRWRTFAVPFSQQIKSDPTSILTDEFFNQLIAEMCSYANRLKRQGYRYEWSAATLDAKHDNSVVETNKLTTLSPLLSPEGELIW